MSEAADFEDPDLTMRVIANQRAIDANQAAINANRAAINTLGVQTAERFMHLEAKMDAGFRRVDEQFRKVDAGFVEMRGKLDQTTAGLTQIIRLLSPGVADET